MGKFKFNRSLSEGTSPVRVLLFSLFSLVLLFAVSAACALVLLSFENPGGSIFIGAFCALLISAIISGVCSAMFLRDIKLSAISLGVVSGIILAFGIIFGGGGFMNAVCYFGVSMLVSFFCEGRIGQRRKR